jgi:hypothetical protein
MHAIERARIPQQPTLWLKLTPETPLLQFHEVIKPLASA